MYYRPKASTNSSQPTQGVASSSSGQPSKKVDVASTSTHNVNERTTNKVPKASSSKSAANVSTSNPFDSLAVDEDVQGGTNLEGEEVVNTFDESGNLFDKSGASTPALNVPDV